MSRQMSTRTRQYTSSVTSDEPAPCYYVALDEFLGRFSRIRKVSYI